MQYPSCLSDLTFSYFPFNSVGMTSNRESQQIQKQVYGGGEICPEGVSVYVGGNENLIQYSFTSRKVDELQHSKTKGETKWLNVIFRGVWTHSQ
jgi:hypothetical protein